MAKRASADQLPLFVPDSPWTPPSELPSLRGRTRLLAYDVETKDVDLKRLGPGVRRGAKIVGFSVGTDDGHRWYLPIRHEGGGNLDEDVVLRWAREELNAFDGEVVGTNLGYDLDFSYEEGITFERAKGFHDVQIAEPLLDEHRLRYDLDALSEDYLGEGKDESLLMEGAAAYGARTAREAKGLLWRMPANLVGPYGEGDADRPLRILPLQLKKLEAEGLTDLYDMERKLIPLLVRMRRRGVRLDVAGIDRLRTKFARERDRWLAELKRLAGPKAELMEPLSFYKALEEAGVDVPRTKKTEQPSVTKPLLERYQTIPLVRVLLQGRRLNTLLNTFIDGQIGDHLIGDRLHPTWNQLKGEDAGTIARFSCTHPNLQFIPAREAEWQEEPLAAMVRGLFLPDEGESWQRDDYSQIEYRLLVNFAVGKGAEEARQKYISDPKTDFHLMTMRMLGIPDSERKKAKGMKTKITNFAKVYGAQPPKLASQMGCSVDEAYAFVEEYDRELPFVKETLERAAWWAQRRGYVETVLKRRQRFPLWGPKRYKSDSGLPLFRSREEAAERYGGLWKVERVNTYKALNGKMQGSSADITKKAMTDADAAGLTAESALGPFLITVHDELGSSVKPTKESREAGEELTRIMERAVALKVPIVVDSARGATWAECK
jgi:DNA polymerase I-like protein with 3'-5' exonuclease and polymerase domains